MPEIITFKGVTFRRYPEAKGRAERVYYNPHIADRQKGVGRLHEEIWKAHHGPIPEGCHIHHKDGDPLNNSLDNLECLTAKQHAAQHKDEFAEVRRRNLDKFRHLAAEWHRSEEGRAWHRKNGQDSWKNRKPRQEVCQQCGATYETLKPTKNTRFCSNKCKSAERRASGVDDESRTCEACGNEYTCNRYSKKRACSPKCGRQLRNMRP